MLNTSSQGENRRIDPSALDGVRNHLATRVVGQRALVDSMLICLVSEGHLLVEGMPGLANTTAVKALAEGIEGDYHRIQFTPDLLPSDLIGTDIYRHERGEFEFRPGPLFHNILLADEVNRAPAKVQSALLEAMQERQVTIGSETFPLEQPFLVLATQNPIEQEGTYPLPEAQLDRFLMHVLIEYPDEASEAKILRLVRGEEGGAVTRDGPAESRCKGGGLRDLLAARTLLERSLGAIGTEEGTDHDVLDRREAGGPGRGPGHET